MIHSLRQQAGACSGPALLACRPQKLQGKLAMVGERGGVIVNGMEIHTWDQRGELQACFPVGQSWVACLS